MSAHRRAPRKRPALRRTLTAALVALVGGTGFLATAGPAAAAGPWFVGPGGSNASNCLTVATRCATVTGVLAKPGFVSGDTINVAPGTYTDKPLFQTKTANVVGTGPGVVFSGTNSTYAIGVLLNPATQTLNLTNVTLTAGRPANGAGGGLALGAGKVVASDVTISGNTSTNAGGGAYVGAGTTLTMTGGAVTNNASANQGGGIYSAGTTVLDGTAVTNNTATSLGGGIAVAAGSLAVTGGSLSNNTALNAGGLFNATSATIDGTTVNNNVGNGGATANGGNGGAIYNAANLTVRNADFTGNKVVASTAAAPGITGYGGAIFSASLSAAAAPQITITDTEINGGAVGGGNAAIGGAIAGLGNIGAGGANTRLDATGLTLSKNVALAGGGIFTYGQTKLTGSTLDQNKATHGGAGYGGALYAAVSGAAPTVTVDDTDLTGNTAQTGGGAIIAGAGVTTEIRNGSSVSGNSAPVGGGVYNGGALTIRSSHVDDNSASNSGGGVYSVGSATLVGTTVDDNSAAFLGGGILTSTGALTASGGHVNGNDAFGGGGVVVGDNAPASFDGTDFVGNTATGSGGGAILSGGATSVLRANLTGNRAIQTTPNTGLGGAIYSGSNSANANTRLTVGASTISGNEAYAASAVFAFSNGSGATNKTSIDNTTITGNASSSALGAIEQFHPMTITNSTITDNTAVDPNGGVVAGALMMFAPSQVGVAGTIIAGNDGLACSGAVSDGGHNLGDDGTALCGFTPAKNDVTGDPQLGALQDNDGPTRTRLPGPASPALDKVPASTGTGLSDAITGSAVTLCGPGSEDQRGKGRPQGTRCDIGAVEVVQDGPTVDGPAGADYTVGSAGAPVTFTTTGTPQPTLSKTGSLPAGVTFQDNGDGTATLSGTPGPGTGGEYPITVIATNEAGSDSTSFTLVVSQAPLLSGPSAATYTVGQPGGPDVFEQTSGHPDATLSTDSDLPSGVTFTPEPGGKGTIAGTPGAGTGGVYPVTINASNGTAPDATWPFELTVNEAASITGPASAAFTVGTAGASGEFTGSGFPAPTFTASGLPDGLGVTGTGAGTAKISGTAGNGTGGEYVATLTATNGVGDDAEKDVQVTVNEAPELTGPSEARFVVGAAATIGFASDGYPGATISSTGVLPDGLTFVDHGDGTATIGGTPAAGTVGSYAITVTASNGIDPDSVIDLTLEVVPPMAISTTSLPDAAVGAGYSALVEVSGGQPAYTFEVVAGSLPTGLTLSANGQITGTPTGPAGTATFTVQATDGSDPANTASTELSIAVVKGTTSLDVAPVVLETAALNLRVGIVKATLTGGSPAQPIAGQAVVFKAGAATVCTAVTTADGTATCKMNVLNTLLVVLNLGVSASYAGNASWNPSTGSSGLIG